MKKKYLTFFMAVLIMLLAFSDITLSGNTDDDHFRYFYHSFEDSGKRTADKPFSMVWFSDPQYYASTYPEIYDFLGNWLVSEYKKGGFGYAINTGDIVNNAGNTNQWEVSSRNFKKLDDSHVPYGVLPGNHDISNHGIDYSMYTRYFGVLRFINNPWYGGSINNNINHFDLISFGSHDFIVLYLGYNTKLSMETVTWANKVLKLHSHRTAILALHEYLTLNSSLSGMANSVLQNIIKKNDNVVLVLSGHYHGAARNRRIVKNTDGSSRCVLEILADYQNAPKGGNGFLRFLTFKPDSGSMSVITFSPYINKYNYFKNNVDSFTEKIRLIN